MNIWSTLDPAQLINLTIVVPLIGAAFIALFSQQPNLREGVSIITAVVLFTLVLAVTDNTFSKLSMETTWVALFPGLEIAYSVEPLGVLFALVASFLWIITTIYSIGYMRGHNEENQTRFFFCFALSISTVMAICFSANLLTLFIFYELLTLSTYPLVTHAGTKEAKHGGRVYLGVLLSTSIVLFLLAILGTWVSAGTLNFTPGGVFTQAHSDSLVALLLVLFCYGIGKAALMPFHRWLPAAMVAPTPASSLLHAVAVVKAGVFSILKVVIYIFGIDNLSDIATTDVMLYIGTATVLLSSCVAMTKDSLKARLAYSTVSQLSYIVVGALLASSVAAAGASLHIATHAVGKITLFFCAGAIMVAAHKKNISEMVGLGRKMPITMIAFAIAALSIIGLPPMAGTWSKWYLMVGAVEADKMIIVVVLTISSLLNVAYLLPIPIKAFFNTPSGDQPAWSWSETKEAPLPSLIAIVVTTTACLWLFFYPQPLIDLINLIPDVSTELKGRP
ncbi:monovalent cation/H+ antiporter subunit D family protein [Psychrobium sp. 1_MG-2023]|uniref:monovalent cation/H+ antiporter subunit D family protein n=1 Tax=Psychrobium sp. 1_MG-2023 TaxID=3062624 RepID=UPI000C33EC3E|nr:monovalent cation/H+ antiporter subunit D family protein [Psychrobium sp. 1_MG-2023]MDP2560357.1 monovalent cation/H+ antiporter subunit D family protein [Psychrobium sp. 1_MG-2023]PKF55467.1 cation:proton antiporter [Alteromonadales bacterium alter-6D02]